MAFANRLESLRQKHAGLERQLEEEYARPLPDDIEIKRLKVAKLRLKEEIAALSGGSDAGGPADGAGQVEPGLDGQMVGGDAREGSVMHLDVRDQAARPAKDPVKGQDRTV